MAIVCSRRSDCLESGGLESIIHNILEAFNKKDLTRMTSFFADDATFIRPEGTFRGKEEIKRYYTWSFSNYSELTLTAKGFIVEGNKAVLEFVSEALLPGVAPKNSSCQGWLYSSLETEKFNKSMIIMIGF